MNKICEILLVVKKKCHLSARVMTRLSSYLGMTRVLSDYTVLLVLKSGQVIANRI